MEARRTPDGIRVGGNARQRFHDARGYGEPGPDGTVLLSPVEAAHLLHRGDLASIDGMGFVEFVATTADPGFAIRYATFADLRDRGFYLDPVDRAAVTDDRPDAGFVVYERGAGRTSSAIAFVVTPVGEHDARPVGALRPGVMAVVDGEGEVGYLEIERVGLGGDVSAPAVAGVTGALVGDRVFLEGPPGPLYREWFFGRPLAGRTATDDVLAISLVEASYLARRDVLDLPAHRIRARGRELWGQSFVRRAGVYQTLRDDGLVPKTGYKFGADFRVYESFAGIEELGHSEHLVRLWSTDAPIAPAALSLDVRLAHGVGKRMVFAITAGNPDTATTWLSVSRLTP